MEAVRRTLLGLVAVAIIIKHASAAQHSVDGSQDWDESSDFNSWASAEKFKVGDQLVFKYSQGLHSAVELGSKSAYKNCDISTSLNSLGTGKDVVKLDKPGTRYFACGTLGHCSQGMKVRSPPQQQTLHPPLLLLSIPLPPLLLVQPPPPTPPPLLPPSSDLLCSSPSSFQEPL